MSDIQSNERLEAAISDTPGVSDVSQETGGYLMPPVIAVYKRGVVAKMCRKVGRWLHWDRLCTYGVEEYPVDVVLRSAINE